MVGRRRIVFLLVTLGAMSVLGLVAAELGLRLLTLRRLGRGDLESLDREPNRDPAKVLSLGDLVTPDGDPRIVFRLLPGVRGVFQGAPVEVNERGYRGKPVAEPKPPGTLRVVALGDSHTFGWGVRDEETFVRLLEGGLRALAPDKIVEAVNLGTPGANAVQEVRLFETRGLALEPDLVVVQYELNDVLVPAFLMKVDVWKPLPLHVVTLARHVARRALGRGGDSRTEALEAFPMFRRAAADSPVEVRPEDVPERYRGLLGRAPLEAAYRRLAELCRERGIPLLLLLPAHELMEDVPGLKADPEYDSIRALAAELGIEAVDTFAETRQIARARGAGTADLMLSYPDDLHPTPARHAIMARILLPAAARALKIGSPAALEAERKKLDERIAAELER